MTNYKTISSVNFAELTVKKSKFISVCTSVNNKQEIDDFLTKLKQQHLSVNHLCYAYILNTGEEKVFDDGEPSGTAGLPILNIIKRKQLTNILIVVIRYFGGIKLGAGGLIRAYSKAANQCLNNAQIAEYEEFLEYQITLSYDEASKLEKLENKNLFEITKKQYLDNVVVNLIVLEQNKNGLQEFLNAIFSKNNQLTYIKTILKEKK